MISNARLIFSSRLRRLAVPLFLVVLAVFIAVTDARKEKIRGDFSEFTLRASKVMMAGYDPYNKDYVGQNYKYFPTNALLVWPLSKVSVYVSQGVWFAINAGLLIWAFHSLKAMLRPIKIPWWVTFAALAITFRVIVMNLRLGQWNTSVFCFSIIGLRYLHDGARTGGSLLLSLAITLKYMPVIFLAYLAARRRWKDLAATCAAAIFWILLFPAIVLGPSRTTELMQRFYKSSTERVEQMTSGQLVNSQSVHSAIYRTLSPVAQDNDGGIFYVNILNLPRDTAALIAKTFSFALLIAAIVWLSRQHRKALQINQVGTLLLIGLCYLVWYIAAPGVRHAQLIGILPLTFAIAAAASVTDDQRTRKILIAGLILVFVMFTSPAEIVEDTNYNRILEAYGILPLTLLVEIALGLYAFYRVGSGSFVSSSWEVRDDSHSLVGDPRY